MISVRQQEDWRPSLVWVMPESMAEPSGVKVGGGSPTPLKQGKSLKKVLKANKRVDAAVLQALGSVGNASLVDEDESMPVRVLLYRLVALSTDGPWGDGLLLDLARSTTDNDELQSKIFQLMDQDWRSDPARLKQGGSSTPGSAPAGSESAPAAAGRHSRLAAVKHGLETIEHAAEAVIHTASEIVHHATSAVVHQVFQGYHLHNGPDEEDGLLLREQTLKVLMPHGLEGGKTWREVLLHGRGTVGETALHLCCLLSTPQHKRLIKILVSGGEANGRWGPAACGRRGGDGGGRAEGVREGGGRGRRREGGGRQEGESGWVGWEGGREGGHE